MKKIILLFLPFFLVLFACHHQAPPTLQQQLDALLSKAFPDSLPGGSVLVAWKGRVIYRKAFGMANMELKVPMRPEYVFRIGSITKQFTACAIMKLAEEGKLSLKDNITRYLPGYPVHGYTLTIENLLTHTSGIQNYTDLPEWDEAFQRRDMTPEKLIGWFEHQPMDFAPGEQFSYSNSGYVILGYIVEKVSGISYTRFVEDSIIKPLGLAHTLFDDTRSIVPGRVEGYQKADTVWQNANYLSMTQPYAAGALLSNIDDLYAWYKAVMEGKVLPKDMLAKAFTPYMLKNGMQTGYGYGWFLGNIQGSRTIEHAGGINGFLSSTIYLPQEDAFVAVLTNSTDSRPTQVAAVLAALAIGKPYEYKNLHMQHDSLNEYAGVYRSEYNGLRYVTVADTTLYAMISGGDRLQFIPYAKDKFYMKGGFTKLEFRRDSAGTIVSLVSVDRSSPISWEKTNLPVPEKKKIDLPAAMLDQYTGVYPINSRFSVTITREGNQLWAKGTGQERFQIFPESSIAFFAKETDILIEFVKVMATGSVVMLLHEGGAVYKAERQKKGKQNFE